MVDQVIAKQELIDAQKDAQSLDDFINGGGEQIVVTRLLKEYPTLANAIRQIYEKGGKFYPTLEAANADITNIRTDVYVITGDNGAYYKATAGATSLTKSPYDAVNIAKQFTLSELLKYLESISTRSGWALPFVDSIKQILGGFDTDGKFWAQNVAVVDELLKLISRVTVLDGLIFTTPDPVRTGVIFTIQDNDGSMLLHLSSDFTLYVAGIPVGVSQEIIDDITALASDIAIIKSNLNPLTTFTALGDSLTEGAGSSGGNTYPYYLAQATGRSVSNQGIGGQDAARISARLNGTTVLVTLPNNQIPADTSPVTVTLSIPLLTTPATTAARTRKVIINGISGTLSKDISNSYTFARDVVGTVVNVAPNTAMIIDTGDLQKRIALLWMGTNNSFATEADRKAIIDHIDAAIAALKPMDKRYLVLSPWKPASNIKGSDTHNQMLELHKLLAGKYKDRFINVWYDLVCSYDPNTPQDVIDFGNMVKPSSKMSDSTHPNSDGYQIVAQSVFSKINQLGW